MYVFCTMMLMYTHIHTYVHRYCKYQQCISHEHADNEIHTATYVCTYLRQQRATTMQQTTISAITATPAIIPRTIARMLLPLSSSFSVPVELFPSSDCIETAIQDSKITN